MNSQTNLRLVSDGEEEEVENQNEIEICAVCNHPKSEHAVMIDGLYDIEARRHCLHQEDGKVVCDCQVFKTEKDPAHYEQMESLRKVGMNRDVLPDEEEPVMERNHGPICERCLNSKYPGTLWPMESRLHDDGTRKHNYIQKCDDCDLFKDDAAAAFFLSAVLGIHIQQDEYGYWYTPMPSAFIESVSRANRIG